MKWLGANSVGFNVVKVSWMHKDRSAFDGASKKQTSKRRVVYINGLMSVPPVKLPF